MSSNLISFPFLEVPSPSIASATVTQSVLAITSVPKPIIPSTPALPRHKTASNTFMAASSTASNTTPNTSYTSTATSLGISTTTPDISTTMSDIGTTTSPISTTKPDIGTTTANASTTASYIEVTEESLLKLNIDDQFQTNFDTKPNDDQYVKTMISTSDIPIYEINDELKPEVASTSTLSSATDVENVHGSEGNCSEAKEDIATETNTGIATTFTENITPVTLSTQFTYDIKIDKKSDSEINMSGASKDKTNSGINLGVKTTNFTHEGSTINIHDSYVEIVNTTAMNTFPTSTTVSAIPSVSITSDIDELFRDTTKYTTKYPTTTSVEMSLLTETNDTLQFNSTRVFSGTCAWIYKLTVFLFKRSEIFVIFLYLI